MKQMYSSSAKKKVTLILLDYDGTAAYLHKHMDDVLQNNSQAKEYPYLKKSVDATRSALHQVLTKVSHEADIVELADGSARQTRFDDRNAAQYNHNNGLCCEQFADLADEYGWIYNRLLLGDVEDEQGRLRTPPLSAGTTMGPLGKQEDGKYHYLADEQAESYRTAPDESKIRLMELHVKDLQERYPASDYEVKLVLIDDSLTIINGIENHFQNTAHHSQCSIELVHFNCKSLFHPNRFDPACNEDTMNKAALREVSYKMLPQPTQTIELMGTNSLQTPVQTPAKPHSQQPSVVGKHPYSLFKSANVYADALSSMINSPVKFMGITFSLFLLSYMIRPKNLQDAPKALSIS